jgi:hypothetical protein
VASVLRLGVSASRIRSVLADRVAAASARLRAVSVSLIQSVRAGLVVVASARNRSRRQTRMLAFLEPWARVAKQIFHTLFVRKEVLIDAIDRVSLFHSNADAMLNHKLDKAIAIDRDDSLWDRLKIRLDICRKR